MVSILDIGVLRFTGWCLDKEDLCVAKLVALREKDRNFVAALLKADLVDANLIASRLRTIPRKHVAASEATLPGSAQRIEPSSKVAERLGLPRTEPRQVAGVLPRRSWRWTALRPVPVVR